MNIFGIGSFSSYLFWLFLVALNVIALANFSYVILIPLWLIEAIALFLIVRWANAPDSAAKIAKEEAEYKHWRQYQWGNFDKTIADIEARDKLAKERVERYEREDTD